MDTRNVRKFTLRLSQPLLSLVDRKTRSFPFTFFNRPDKHTSALPPGPPSLLRRRQSLS